MSKWDVIKALEATINTLTKRIATLETQQLTMLEIKPEETLSILNFVLENPYLSVPIVTLGFFGLGYGYSYFFNKNINDSTITQSVEATPVDQAFIEEQLRMLTQTLDDYIHTQETFNISNTFINEVTLDFIQEISVESLESARQIGELAIIVGS